MNIPRHPSPRPANQAGTVVKALEVLNLLGEHPAGVTAAEMARETGHPFSTCYRLLATLVGTGYASYDAADKRYHLGLRVFRLAHAVAAHQGFEGSAAPVLHRLTEQTQESSVLHVLDGDAALTVHKEDGPQFRTTTDPGDRAPLHSTASGKILLAFSEPQLRERLTQEIDLTPRTPHTVTDRAELERQLAAAQERGWTSQSEEQDPGMVAIAAPVLAPSGRLLGAVTLAAPLFRRTARQLEEHIPALLEATRELGLVLPSR
ncbi:transcriptional regulator [Kocuria varians]|uniref:Glycerol operon regulatory protein n=1 Tax=Kocuria varians TaxID=1272 RepID=A0A4Y4D8R9_KOCVA|nr:IclR family transcriptional regulator [Kocuria varians]GEC99687.1 transcriptional regulator [Kocuria varians]